MTLGTSTVVAGYCPARTAQPADIRSAVLVGRREAQGSSAGDGTGQIFTGTDDL